MEENHEVRHRKREVPIWERPLLTIYEAADYTGIGTHRLRQLAEETHGSLTLWVGSRRMFKRKKLEEYLDNSTTI